MKNGNPGILVSLLVMLAVIGIGVWLSDDNKSSSSSSSSSSYSTSGYSSSSKSNYNSGGGGYRSSYWYDSKDTQKKKADATLRKYYDVDDNGHILGPKEGTIRNGKPYKKTK